MTGIKAMKDATPEYFEKLYKQFYTKAEAIIKNKANKKPKNKETKKEEQTYYLYF